jgi:4-hydroxybenzoate polyprenyltransferase
MVSNLLSTLLEIIKLARVQNLAIIIISQYFTAFFIAKYDVSIYSVLIDVELFLLILSTVIITSAGYFINDYYDIKIDMIIKPIKVIVGNKLERRPVLIWHSIYNFIGIGIGAYISIWIGLINLFAAFLLWLYSNQLKRMPLIGNISVSILTGLSVLSIAAYYRTNEYLIFIYAFFAFGISLIREIIKDIEDMKGDEIFGCRSLPIVYGILKTKLLLYGFILSFGFSISLFLGYQSNYILNLYFLILILPSLYFIYLLYKADRVKHFSQLSTYCKWLMLSGVLSMIFI